MAQIVSTNRQRISSIDILRGIIMLIMALDHTRDFFHKDAILDQPTNLATTTPFLFFTRWITHYCAPTFLFLSGVSAFISGQRKTKAALSAFLIKRGLWLIVVDIFVMTFLLTFNPFYNIFFLSVLWAIGWSMIILGLLVRGSFRLVAITGTLLFLLHNVFDYVTLPQGGITTVLSQVFFTSPGSFFPLGGNRGALVAYAILPWTAIMLLGYTAGALYKEGFDSAKRKKLLLVAGFSLILLFLFLRIVNSYGDPAPWSVQKSSTFTFLSFLNVTKYPVSLQFSCMTLGPALIVLALIEPVSNRLTRFAGVYGRVPFFYFIGHFFLIHIICMIVFFATGHSFAEASDQQSPFLFRPAKFGFSLPVVYAVWLTVILLMYYPCKWFDSYKQTHRKWWLSYL